MSIHCRALFAIDNCIFETEEDTRRIMQALEVPFLIQIDTGETPHPFSIPTNLSRALLDHLSLRLFRSFTDSPGEGVRLDCVFVAGQDRCCTLAFFDHVDDVGLQEAQRHQLEDHARLWMKKIRTTSEKKGSSFPYLTTSSWSSPGRRKYRTGAL